MVMVRGHNYYRCFYPNVDCNCIFWQNWHDSRNLVETYRLYLVSRGDGTLKMSCLDARIHNGEGRNGAGALERDL